MSNADVARKLKEVLEWELDLPVLDSLMTALHVGTIDLTSATAICFDSNVFLNLGKGRQGADVIDYLNKKHAGPIILPSQVVIEFWNNHLNSIGEYVSGLRSQFEKLNETVEKIRPEYSELKDGAKILVQKFQEEFGYVFSMQSSTDLQALLEMLSKNASVSQIPRAEYSQIAIARKRTKTPPGFKDSGDGDFFLWAEFLQGLLLAKTAGKNFDQALLVTDDRTKDWSTNGIPHPILSAELFALIAVPFRVMTLTEFKNAVQISI